MLMKTAHYRSILNLVVLLMPLLGMAQNHRVSGIVSDSQGPVIGATVMLENTSIGVSTDANGQYSLDNVPSNANLIISCIGYVSQTIHVGSQTQIDVVLIEDTEMIEETVVVGYGVQKKSDVTGSISQVKAEDMENRTIASADQALQGKTAGVVVLMGSASPGASPMIRVRGFSSNASSDPLYVVDGLRVKASDISGIDPNTITSMEILKDAASAAIYGAQAGNGVVLITTKKGTQGTTRINYEFQQTWQQLARIPKVTHAKDYITYYKEADAGLGVFEKALDTYYDGKTDTDWVDTVFETSRMQRHSLSLSGANQQGSYALSSSYVKNNGILVGDDDTFDRITLSLNADYKIKPWLKVTSNFSLDNSVQRNSITEGTLRGGAISSVLMADPLTPVYGITETMQGYEAQGYPLLGDENGKFQSSEFFISENSNPLINKERRKGLSRRFQIRGNAAFDFTPLKGLTFTSRVGYRLSSSYSNYTSFRFKFSSLTMNDYDLVESNSNMMQYYQWENFANYLFSVGKNNFTAMAGMSFDKTRNSSLSGSANEFMKSDPLYYYLDYKTNSATMTVGGDDVNSTTLSYYGRINWDYDGRYMAQASIRADAADLSILSKKARWGYFPAVSVGWVITREPFFNFVNKDILSVLKLRASWGQNGSIAGLSNYMWRSAIASIGYYNLEDKTSTSSYTTGMKPSTLGNEELTWETSEQLDFGADLQFLKGKLAMTVDYYVKKTKDLIVTGAVPSLVVGNTSSPINGGNVLNKGFEFDLTWRDGIGKDFTYSISANLATLHNEVTYVSDFVSGRLPGASAINYNELTVFEAGYPVWHFNGWQYEGINPETGTPIFTDLTGDGKISDADKTYIGDAIPDFTYGATLNMKYKNLDLIVFGSGSHGNQVFQWLMRPDAKGSNILQTYFDNRWTESNHNGTFPAATIGSSDLAHYLYSNAMVKDGSFFKIKQIQLGYRLPRKIISKVGLTNARAYVSLEDWFNFTPYDGFDPEATSASLSVRQMGIDAGSYPSSKKCVLGVTLSF